MTANAALINTGLHFYFRWLDTRFIGNSTQMVLKKLTIDQLLVAPTTLAFFMSAAVYGRSFSVTEVKEKLSEDYFPTLQANWMVWPAANFVNFKFIPSSYRIIYVASLGVMWNGYLSYVSNRPTEHSAVVNATEPEAA
jgi:protein Mpv17